MRRPKPHQIVLAVGVLAAVGTVASGIAPQITHWHDESPISREVFVNIPGAIQVAFYLSVAAMLFATSWLVSLRVRNYERGAPDDRRVKRSNAKRRMRDFRRGVWMQTLLRDPAAGVMHSMIYFGFLVLFAATVLLEIDHQLPTGMKFLHGEVYKGYAFTADLFGLVFLGGILWAFARRYIQRPYRIRIKTKPEHLVILSVFLVISVTGYLAEGFRIAAEGRPDFERWSFVGWGLSGLVSAWRETALIDAHRWSWIAHVVAFFSFLVILPTTMLRHMITSPMNMFWKDKDRPKGAMKPMPNLLETELESFGAIAIEDFTWKQLFDTDACTVCGRCTSVCPAHATGKSLDPREIVLKVGEVMNATASPQTSSDVMRSNTE
ncbi:MAG: (Fe-S)-binding protein, partial [Acidimicrobiia bacterium]|nr:(Fe-S)-binding protein [Acidimicrobiia bacterium]